MLDIPPASDLLRELDLLPWDPRGPVTIAAAVRDRPPSAIRVANFYRENLEVLRRVPPGPPVLWKVEFCGRETARPMWVSPGTDPAEHTRGLLSTGHTVIAYTFSTWSRDELRRDLPGLPELHVLPLAHREPPPADGPALRAALGVAPGELLLGAAGLLTAEKGFDELVVAFLRGGFGLTAHLLLRVVLDTDHLTADDLVHRWERLAGTPATPRLHVRIGTYGSGADMARFYAAVDAVLVNSVADSWCRMVSEPMGAGVPVVVRRARCGSNHVASGTVLVDSFTGIGDAGLLAAVDRARQRASRLRATVRPQALPVVRAAGAGPAAPPHPVGAATRPRPESAGPAGARGVRRGADPVTSGGAAPVTSGPAGGPQGPATERCPPGPGRRPGRRRPPAPGRR